MKRKIALWKWILIFVAALILGIIGYFLLMTVAQLGNNPILNVIGSFVLILLYALFVMLLERQHADDLSIKRLLPNLSLGLLIGCLFFVVVVGIMILVGCGSLITGSYTWNEQFVSLTLFLSVAVGEEIINRGILFRFIDERWNVWAALIISSFIFGILHLPNDGATWWSCIAIAIEAGLLLGAAYKYSGSLWLPIGIHWAWNFVQGHVFGFSVSGNKLENSFFKTVTNGPDILTGGAFGAEASIISVVVGLSVSIFFIYLFVKRRPQVANSDNDGLPIPEIEIADK